MVPLATISKRRGVQPETSATPCSFMVTGCWRVREATFQKTTSGSL